MADESTKVDNLEGKRKDQSIGENGQEESTYVDENGKPVSVKKYVNDNGEKVTVETFIDKDGNKVRKTTTAKKYVREIQSNISENDGTQKYEIKVDFKNVSEEEKGKLVAGIVEHKNHVKEEIIEKAQKPKSKFKAKFLVPLLIPALLLAGAKGCQQKEPQILPEASTAIVEEMTLQDLNVSFDATLYNVDSPYIYLESMTNAKGQEGMTNNAISGQNVFKGKYYNSDQQYDHETMSSEGQKTFEQIKENIGEYTKMLSESGLDTETKSRVLDALHGCYSEIYKMYQDNAEFMESQTNDYKEATKVYVDENAEGEQKVADATLAAYKSNYTLAGKNVEVLNKIRVLNEYGFGLTSIIVQQSERGDIVLGVEALKEMATIEGLDEEELEALAGMNISEVSRQENIVGEQSDEER